MAALSQSEQVGRSPRGYPPGAYDALKGKRNLAQPPPPIERLSRNGRSSLVSADLPRLASRSLRPLPSNRIPCPGSGPAMSRTALRHYAASFRPVDRCRLTAFAIGVAYRYVWDDPSEASFANYMRSGVHGMGLAASGLGAHLYFNSRLSGRLRRWPLLAEIALRAVVMAIAVQQPLRAYRRRSMTDEQKAPGTLASCHGLLRLPLFSRSYLARASS